MTQAPKHARRGTGPGSYGIRHAGGPAVTVHTLCFHFPCADCWSAGGVIIVITGTRASPSCAS